MDVVNDTWKTRGKSNLVKWLMQKSGITTEQMAGYLGFSVAYFNNKLHRNSFYFEELVIAAYVSGYSFVLTSDDGEEQNVITMSDCFDANSEVYNRIEEVNSRLFNVKRLEYEKLKTKLELMAKKYGFEE